MIHQSDRHAETTGGSQLKALIYHPRLADHYRDMLHDKFDDLELSVSHNRGEAAKHVGTADILLCQIGFPSELLAQARRLRWIQVLGAGVDKFTISHVVPTGVRLTRVTGSFGTSISEYVIAHLLQVTQRMRKVFADQAERVWDEFIPDRLCDKTVGVAGLGNIGRQVIERLLGLGCTVIGLDVQRVDDPRITWYAAAELHEFLSIPDFVVLCLPLTPATQGIMGEAELRAMKNSAYLVNVARGGLVDELALVRALKLGEIAGAILDVFQEEPLPPGSELWALPGVTVTSHISGPADPEVVFKTFCENYGRFLKGETLVNEVDLERGF